MSDPRNRSDISKFLVHLTRRTRNISAEDNLINILGSKTIEARNHHCLFSPKINRMDLTPKLRDAFKTVCFTETPLNQIYKLTAEDFPRRIKLKPHGLVFWRDEMLESGANPAIYLNADGTSLREYLLSEFDRHFDGVKALSKLKRHEDFYKEIIHYYSLVNLMSDRHDFSWEREWRHSGDFKFKFSDVVAIVTENPDKFLRKCEKQLPARKVDFIKRIPIICADWSYEDVVEEMAMKIWEKNA